jgi:hypothetical protein
MYAMGESSILDFNVGNHHGFSNLVPHNETSHVHMASSYGSFQVGVPIGLKDHTMANGGNLSCQGQYLGGY